jgi:hypothetical protein
MKASALVPLWASPTAWRRALPSDLPSTLHEVEVELEIVGNDVDGYHLLMTPATSFTADTWHETLEGAKATAEEAFGISVNEWQE